MTNPEAAAVKYDLSRAARYVVVIAAFAGWLFAGVQMSVTSLVSHSATKDFLDDATTAVPKAMLSLWFARYNAAFLFGAAAGGLIFGWIGDRLGRAKALGWSVICYSVFSALAATVHSPELYVLVRFVGCLGVGGAWPNAIAIASEAWSDVSRPILAGIIGTAANLGLVLMGLLACYVPVTPEQWRWVMVLGGVPVVLGGWMLVGLPESPRWLESRSESAGKPGVTPLAEVFQPPFLTVTLLGIFLGAIPLFGGWGCTNWLIPWADKVGGTVNPALKGWTQVYRSLGASISSLLGGWVAATLGRRPSYFLFSVTSLVIAQYIYNGLTPTMSSFGFWAFMLGTTTGFYFGWLPLCLPEMFPTRVRSTGAGVTFNTGRVATAIGVLGAGALSALPYFDGDYSKIGTVTSCIFAFGMLLIWWLPKTPK